MNLQHPLCPGEMGDLNHYRELQSRLDTIRKEKKELEKRLDPGAQDLEASLEMLTMEAKSSPCNGCPKQKPCSKQMENIKRYKKQVKKIDERIEDIKNWSWENFEKVMDLLIEEGYINSEKPTKKVRSALLLEQRIHSLLLNF